jgi:uncharacterized SAM-binding protein YcdF (DUF218 family)
MRGMVRQILSSTSRTLQSMVGLFGLLGLIVIATGAAIVAQAHRGDIQPADAAIVMLEGDAADDATRVDRAQQLFVDGNISRIVMVGKDPSAGRALLRGGVGNEAVIEVRADNQIDQLVAARQVLEAEHLSSLLLLSEPTQSLRLLKIARDHGMQPFGAPIGAARELSLLRTVEEVGNYFRYVLFQR